MNKEKRCIFHIPNFIDINRKSASNLRPLKMIEAFRENGYIVDVIMGYGKERKKEIKKIKKNIKNNIKYDFLYSESSTMPTLLTENHHIPLYPNLDFGFMKFCKKNNIPLALFYRDIHWKFELYKKDVSFFKRIIAKLFYKYDLCKYNELLDILYIPSEEFESYLNIRGKKIGYKIDYLPPGCETLEAFDCINSDKKNNEKLKIFYVGGISNEIYEFKKLFEAVKKIKKVKLTVCCRESEWQNLKNEYESYMSKNITVIHENSNNLYKYYKEADICSLIFNKNEYMKIAMPFKLFEYLAHNKPIIATNNTAAGRFVKDNKMGWTVDYEIKQIIDLLEKLKKNPNMLEEIRLNQKKVILENTWKNRAKTVIENLEKIK